MSKIVSRVRDSDDDAHLDVTLRPKVFSEFIGQSKAVSNLKIYIEAAKKRKEAIDHILFTGLPGLGKTTLSYLVSNSCGVNIKTTSGPALERPADLVGILTNLQPGEVFFIDEIHRISKPIEEFLYSAMEDFSINIMIDQGPHARSVKIDLPKFTLIGATTREGLLSDPFRARFGILEKLELYPAEDLIKIIKRSSKLLNVEIDDDACHLIGERARGTPRVANRLIKRTRDLAQVKSNNHITKEIAKEGLGMLGIDEAGLDATDRKILQAIITMGGGPIGVKTISASIGEEEDTIEEIYEPYLMQCCFLEKTPRGRRATRHAYEHLKIPIPNTLQQKDIFKEEE